MFAIFAVKNSLAKKVLIAEIIVGALILIGGVFVFATPTNAPTATPSSTPTSSTYISSVLQISIEYPYGWQVDPTFNGIPGIERYQGAQESEFFEVGATNNPTPKKA